MFLAYTDLFNNMQTVVGQSHVPNLTQAISLKTSWTLLTLFIAVVLQRFLVLNHNAKSFTRLTLTTSVSSDK